MNLFHRGTCPVHSDAVEALFAENVSAHERAGQAANHVARSADRTRGNLDLLRKEILRRTDLERRARPDPPTSEVRQVVEDALTYPGLRGLPHTRDKS